jgi:hypothetical protein
MGLLSSMTSASQSGQERLFGKGPFCASVNDATLFKEDLTHLLCDDQGFEDTKIMVHSIASKQV